VGMIRLIVAARARRWWLAWLGIAVLVSVTGGVVLASAAAARRTQAALPQFVAAYGADVGAFALKPAARVVAGLPGVVSSYQLALPQAAPATCRGCRGPARPLALQVYSPEPRGWPGWKLLSGRWPDPADPRQVLASFTLRDDLGVHPGTVLRVPFYASAQLHSLDRQGGPPAPRGPVVSFVVTGIAAALHEFPAGVSPVHDLVTTPAFTRAVLPDVAAVYQYPVRLSGGSAGVSRFAAALHSPAVARHVAGYLNLADQVAAVAAAIHPQVIGWWLLAALAALVALAVIGQALARQGADENEDSVVLAALGATRGQRAGASLAGTALLALAGAAGAIAVAVALSPLAPVGVARIAETSAGVAFDPLVLLPGAAAIVAVTLALGLWPAWRAARSAAPGRPADPARPSAIAGWLAAAGAPPTMLIGVRQALQRRAADGSAPVGTALLGTVMAVTALTATVVFGASLSHLLATPALYGQQFQLNISDTGGDADAAVLGELRRDPAVTRISRGVDATTTINGVTVGGLAGEPVRGRPLFSAMAGHLPRGPGEVALGATTMRQVGAGLGDVVRVTVPAPGGRPRSAPFTVVGMVSFPLLNGTASLGRGALYTLDGLTAVACPPGPGQAACRTAVRQSSDGGLLASVRPGPAGRASIAHYLAAYPNSVSLPTTPEQLVNFGEAVSFPALLGVVLAGFGAAMVAHLLVVSVARRRRELSLLKVLGFARGQVAGTVGWQATTLAVAGLAVGLPLGLAAGQALWRAFAVSFGVVAVPVAPPGLLAVLAAAILVAANLLAAGPAIAAARARPGPVLRAP
jgi:ABC-type lipoprotein release transport system permease subunit